MDEPGSSAESQNPLSSEDLDEILQDVEVSSAQQSTPAPILVQQEPTGYANHPRIMEGEHMPSSSSSSSSYSSSVGEPGSPEAGDMPKRYHTFMMSLFFPALFTNT